MAPSGRVMERLLARFGSREALLRAAEECDLQAFAEAAGTSERRAVEIVSEVLGLYTPDFLATERAEALHEGIVEALQAYAHTAYARNRIRLLRPLASAGEIDRTLEFCMRAKERVSALPRGELEGLLRGLARPKAPPPKFSSSAVVLVESEEECERLSRAGLSRYCRLLTASDPVGLEETEVVVYVCSEGRLDISRLENVVTVPSGAREHEVVPEVALDFFTANRELISTVARLRALLGLESACARVAPILDALKARELDFGAVERAVLRVRDELNEELRRHASELQLSGDEVLEVFGQGVPRRVREVFSSVLASGRERLRELTGHELSPFAPRYPVEVDMEELERARRRLAAETGTRLFEERVRAARELLGIRADVERELREALELDYELALGAFALDHDLHPARPGRELTNFAGTPRPSDRREMERSVVRETPPLPSPHLPQRVNRGEGDRGSSESGGGGITLEGCAHLSLARRPDVERVSYGFGGKDRAVLLTGANSGGKTTLLETIAQAVIMARCGLPVCARSATIELPDALYFFSQQRSLSAGAFEGFLRALAPALMGGGRRLILADELEAMTELEAGARIVAAAIDMVRRSGSTIVVVTHMAREISQFTSVRIDGIEARGLDERYGLIVDRTPRQGYLARSTPELVLRRLAETSKGEEKRVYRELLERVGG
ncbi:MAG: hypothetical protein ACUVV6_00050 [Thermoplasmatota archaeon]